MFNAHTVPPWRKRCSSVGFTETEAQMRLHRLMTGIAVAIAVAGVVTLHADEPTQKSTAKQISSAAQGPTTVSAFATLKGIKAVPMAATELAAVKGQHVHFLDPGGEALHLAGDVKTQNNWENLGGTDPAPVAPSYNGLCVAAGYSGPSAGAILIPGGQFQCPL
jgi:hypothetical protein